MMDVSASTRSSADSGFGVVYLAFGPAYFAMAMASAMSLRLTNPDVPYTMVTNVRPRPSDVPWLAATDRWVDLEEPTERNRHIKTRIAKHSVYARSLYLDADSLVVGDLSFLDFELRHFDVLLSPATGRTTGKHGDPVLLGSDWRLRDAVICNGGVIGFRRSPGSEDLFARWHEHFIALGLRIDQPALAHALHTTTARFYPLGARFNTTASTGRPNEDVTILHYKRRGDRATRRLVQDVATRCLDRQVLPASVLEEALAPSPSKRRQWEHVRARNADLRRRSVATDIRRAASAAGWL